MADQTDVAVYCGFIAAAAGAVLFKGFTGWTAWISFPVGAVLGFVVVAVAVFALIGVAGALFAKADKPEPPRDASSEEPPK